MKGFQREMYFAESILSVIADEDHLGVAVNQPGRHRYRHESEACREIIPQATRVEPRNEYVPWIEKIHGFFYFMGNCFFTEIKTLLCFSCNQKKTIMKGR